MSFVKLIKHNWINSYIARIGMTIKNGKSIILKLILFKIFVVIERSDNIASHILVFL